MHRHHLLDHVQVLDLRLLKHLVHAVDQAAGHTARVQTLDPIGPVLLRQALVDLCVQGVAVDRAAGLVVVAWVGDPLRRTEDVAKALPDFGAEHRDVHVTITRLVHPGGDAGGVEVTRLRGHFFIDQPARGLEIHHVDHRLQQRGVQPLALT